MIPGHTITHGSFQSKQRENTFDITEKLIFLNATFALRMSYKIKFLIQTCLTLKIHFLLHRYRDYTFHMSTKFPKKVSLKGCSFDSHFLTLLFTCYATIGKDVADNSNKNWIIISIMLFFLGILGVVALIHQSNSFPDEIKDYLENKSFESNGNTDLLTMRGKNALLYISDELDLQ